MAILCGDNSDIILKKKDSYKLQTQKDLVSLTLMSGMETRSYLVFSVYQYF